MAETLHLSEGALVHAVSGPGDGAPELRSANAPKHLDEWHLISRVSRIKLPDAVLPTQSLRA